MSNQTVKDRSVKRILVGVLGILVILGMMVVAYVFMRGVVAGVVLAGCVIALFWLSRSIRRRR
ncbi:MAG: hypothetical protein ACE5H6_03675 [Dehalococcoidia bacterium]